MRQIRLPLAIPLLCLSPVAGAGSARADSPFDLASGVTISSIATLGTDVDEALDFEGSHPILGLGIGFILPFGTEPFFSVGAGFGGHEALFSTWSLGLRQRLRFDNLQPYAELGLADVSDSGGNPSSAFVGAGVDLAVSNNWTVGLAGGYYFSDESAAVSGYGSLDWYARGQLTYRFGKSGPKQSP